MNHRDLKAQQRIDQLKTKHPAYASYCSHLERRGFRPRTLESYADCLAVYDRWLDGRDPMRIAPSDLDHFRHWLMNDYRSAAGRSVSLGRQGYYIAVLRGFYEHCHREHLIPTNPAATLRYPKTPRRLHRDLLTSEEVCRLIGPQSPEDAPDAPIDASTLRDRVAIRLMLLTGLRVSEAAGVAVADVDLPGRTLIVRSGKGGHDRLTFIDTTTQHVITRYLLKVRATLVSKRQRPAMLPGGKGKKKSPATDRAWGGSDTPDTLLLSDAGQPMTRDQLLAVVKRHAKHARIGKPITCHSLRRSFATLMLKAAPPGSGMTLRAIGELMGHVKLETTARYAQVDLRSLSEAYAFAHPRANGADLIEREGTA